MWLLLNKQLVAGSGARKRGQNVWTGIKKGDKELAIWPECNGREVGLN